MKLGTAWFGFREQTMSNYFGMASTLGLPYVEMPLYWHIIEDKLFRYNRVGIDEVKEEAERAGVRMVSGVAASGIGGRLGSKGKAIDRSTVDFAMACARRVIDMSSQLGLEVVRLCEPNLPSDKLDMAREFMTEYGKALGKLAEYAAERNVVVCAENYGLRSEHVNWMLDAADHPNVGTLYDPCNYFRLGEDPLQALKNLRERVCYCHLKDAIRSDPRNPEVLFKGSRWPPSVAVGEGDIEWGPIVKGLSQFYKGYLCFEYEMADDVMRGIRASITHIRQAAKEQDVELPVPGT